MKEFFKRNRNVLLISLALFLICAIGCAIYAHIAIGDKYGMISQRLYEMKANGTLMTDNKMPRLNTLDLYLHNLGADMVVILGGLLFSVFSVLIVIFNAATIAMPFGTDFTYAVVTILPHGIIEYAALVFSLACAFNITKLEIKMIKNRSFRNTLNEHKRELKDILIMIVIVVVLLAIAAIIECNLVEYIMRWFFGF